MTEFSDALLLIPIAKIKEILGIPAVDVTNDAALEQAAPIVTQYFEAYCCRGLAFDDEVIEEVDMDRRIPVHRYPIQAITAIDVAGTPQAGPFEFEKYRGMVLFYMPHWLGISPACTAQIVRVTYSGGYPIDDVPLDLAHAYARCCADFIGLVPPIGGGASGGAGPAPLKSLSLGSGALAVGFETSGQAADSFDTSDAPALLQPYAFTLRRYLNRYV